MAVTYGVDDVVYGTDAVLYAGSPPPDPDPDPGGLGALVYGADSVLFGSFFVLYGVTVPEPPVDPPITFPTGATFRPVVWTWAIGPGASASSPGPIRELVEARDRRVTWRVAGHAFAQFTVDGRAPEAALIVERETDVWVYRDGVLLFRGRVIRVADDIDATSHTANVSIVDYRGMLGVAARIGPVAPTFTSTAQGAIVWDLVDAWQSEPGGDWGITNGIGAAGGALVTTSDINPGTPVAEVVDDLAEEATGFEWEVDELLALNRWYPARGSSTGVVLDYGGNVSKVMASTPSFTNATVATGSTTTSPVAAAAGTVGTDQRGRWASTVSFPQIQKQAALASKASWIVDQGSSAAVEYAAWLRHGRWEGRDHIWIGDTVQFRCQSGRLQVSDLVRVAELAVDCGNDGTETVSVGLVGAS